jgi:hypothetical protein
MKQQSLLSSLMVSAGVISACLFAVSVQAAPAESNAKVEQEIAQLQQRLNQLDAKVGQTQQRKPLAQQLAAKTAGASNNVPLVSISPYVGVQSHFDGSELIINNPSINDDVKLLGLRQQERKREKAMGQSSEHPRLILSGYVQGTANATSYTGDNSSSLDLSDAALDAYAEVSPWVGAFMSMEYDSTDASSSIFLDQGFITIGNFDHSPYYTSLGQMYVPFGQYSSSMVTDPITKTLGRIKTRALVAGYQSQAAGVAPYAAAFVFNGSTDFHGDTNSTYVGSVGANMGVAYHAGDRSADVGVSAVNNLAQSQGFAAAMDNYTNGPFVLSKKVPGVDVHAQAGQGAYTVLAEYLTATERYDDSDVQFNGQGARPSAMNLEGSYAFNLWRPSSVTLAYGQSWDALALDQAERRYSVAYGVSVWRHTLLILELARNQSYQESDQASLNGGGNISPGGLSRYYNTANLQLNAYF